MKFTLILMFDLHSKLEGCFWTYSRLLLECSMKVYKLKSYGIQESSQIFSVMKDSISASVVLNENLYFIYKQYNLKTSYRNRLL